MGDLEERVIRLETTVQLMQTQLEAINKNIFGELVRNVQTKIPSVFAKPVPEDEEIDYSNEPSPPEGQGGGRGFDEGAEEILGDIGEPFDHPRVDIPEQIELKPLSFDYFNLKACQVVLTRIPPDQLIKHETRYSESPSKASRTPQKSAVASSSKRRVVLTKEDYSNGHSYNLKPKDLPCICAYCLQKFPNTQILNHLTSEHSTSTQPRLEMEYKCKFCHYCFKSQEELEEHHSSKANFKYTCPDCPVQHFGKSTLLQHWSRAHDQSTEFLCAYCSHLTYNPRDLANHFRYKHPDETFKKYKKSSIVNKKYKCPAPGCSRLVAGTKQRVNDHLRRHHPGFPLIPRHEKLIPIQVGPSKATPQLPRSSPPPPLEPKRKKIRLVLNRETFSKAKTYNPKSIHLPSVCGYCSAKWSSTLEILDHLSSAHTSLGEPPISKIHKCAFCSNCYKSNDELEAHLASKSDKNYICSQCPANYMTKASLVMHWSRTHDQSTQLVCEYCSKVSHNSMDLANHFRSFHPDARFKRNKRTRAKGSHMCHVCSKVFSYEFQLKRHLPRHDENRARSVCEKCGASYLNKEDLRLHMREKHMGITRAPKLCPICGVNVHWSSVRGHMISHREKTFACPYCPAKFKEMVALRGHRSKHTKELAVDCPTCGKTCANPYNLKVHMTLHYDNYDFKCKAEGCSRKFKNADQMREHFRLRHKKKGVKVEEN